MKKSATYLVISIFFIGLIITCIYFEKVLEKLGIFSKDEIITETNLTRHKVSLKNAQKVFKQMNLDLAIEPLDLVTIKNSSEINLLRQNLYKDIFRGWNKPYLNKVSLNIEEQAYLSNLVDMTNIELQKNIIHSQLGFTSEVFHFKKRGHQRVAILILPGHPIASENADYKGTFSGHPYNIKYIKNLLNLGVDVLATSMPTEGNNTKPVLTLRGHGNISFSSLGDLVWLETEKRSAMGLIFRQIEKIVDTYQNAYSCIDIIGISRGGWATQIFGAIDKRPCVKLSVSGWESASIMERLNGIKSSGKWLYNKPEFYSKYSYQDLSIMAANCESTFIRVFLIKDYIMAHGPISNLISPKVKQSVEKNCQHSNNLMMLEDDTVEDHIISDYVWNIYKKVIKK